MFPIEYEDWRLVCSQTLIHKRGRKQAYIQWYPFACLTSKHKEILMSESYFNDYVQTGLMFYFPETWHISDNYLMKGDSSFRHASLVSPTLYLLVLAIGHSFATKYVPNRPDNVEIYYAGNFREDRLFYQKDYDNFHKRLNELSDGYHYFIKTDIKDFFPNINLNRLFNIINKRLLENGEKVTQKDLLAVKELLLALGQGEFPLLDNSTTTSYLSTVVYLEEADSIVSQYISDSEPDIIDYSMVRYVDDLYILFNVRQNESFAMMNPMMNRILDCYVDALKKVNLSLSREKTVWKTTDRLNKELKQSLYNEYIDDKTFSLADFVDENRLLAFLDDIKNSQVDFSLDITKYNDLIEQHFSLEGIRSSAKENYNAIIYERHALFQNENVVNILLSIIGFDYAFMKLDTRRFVVMMLKTENGNLIKQFLSRLFRANRDGTWNIYDTSLALNYLLQRKFKHQDLLKIVEANAPDAHKYISLFCKRSFMLGFLGKNVSERNHFLEKIFHKNDDKLFLLYFLFKTELFKGNYLSAYAYYKNFFDRISAHIGMAVNGDKKGNRPNYKAYYKEGAFRTLYNDCADSASIIKTAHILRNSNPLSHSSAELIDNKNSFAEILCSIEALEKMVIEKINKIC